jgi:hypothetical protein
VLLDDEVGIEAYITVEQHMSYIRIGGAVEQLVSVHGLLNM